MPSQPAKNINSSARGNISFYDAIASSYNSLLDKENFNVVVRKKVSEKFINLVKPGDVLDFGGGTGLDLDWLTANGYNVIFCEPSEQMRQKAIELHSNKKSINFLPNEKTDFTKWDDDIPFACKIEGILSNFAVINCIPDIYLLFESLSFVLKPGGHFVALVLDNRYKKQKTSFFSAVKELLFQKPSILRLQHNEHEQTVYMHTIHEIKKASAARFHFSGQEPLRDYGFTLIHLVRK